MQASYLCLHCLSIYPFAAFKVKKRNPPSIFVLLFYVCCMMDILVHSRPNFTMVAKTMNPDQTAPKGSCLIWVHIVCNTMYKVPKHTRRREEKNEVGP